MRNVILPTAILFFMCWANVASAEKYALLIGIEDYHGTGMLSLKGPGNDVEIIKHVLGSRYGFQSRNIAELKNGQASHSGIEKAFDDLGEKIKQGDFVYIHYSGHGSMTPDLNGDERSGHDQTWVPFGSRIKGKKGKDGYDILDDELNEWLVPIFDKAEHVIFVSDSCYSSSVTRGDAPLVRAGSVDNREHPLGRKKFKSAKFETGVRIGASRDNEPAAEFPFKDGKNYGLFTWHWAKALQQAWIGETWGDLYQRTFAMVTDRRNSQQPQMQGKGNLPVFGEKARHTGGKSTGAAVMHEERVTVSQIFDGGKRARIEAGFLSNVTVGSAYRLFNPSVKITDGLPFVRISEVKPFCSIGETNGPIKMGDLLVEEEHAYGMEIIRVFLNADDPKGKDRGALGKIRSLFASGALPEYEITNNQKDCMMVLYVLRPQKNDGDYIRRRPEDTLPKSFPDQKPEVWVLTDVERLMHDNLRISLADYDKGLDVLTENLKKIARIREIKKLASIRPPQFEITTTLWQPVEKCAGDNCLVAPDGKTSFKMRGRYNIKEMEMLRREKKHLKLNTLLTFALKNNSQRSLYAYIINLMSNGEVNPVFPTLNERREDALVRPGEELDSKEFSGLTLDEPGEEMIKLIVTEKPINIAILQQSEFTERPDFIDPLERLLAYAVHGRRGSTVNMRVEQWGTVQYSFYVK